MIVYNEETKFILGRPNFWCGAISMRLRELGHEIPRKSEDEQSYVIHWMLEFYERYGDSWRMPMDNYLRGKNNEN